MALIFEDSQKVTKKQIPIPQNAKKVFKAMKKIYEPYLNKNISGSKILKSLGSDKKYNKKGTNANSNGDEIKQDSVNVNDAKVRLHRMNKLPKNSIEYQLNGGELAASIYRKGIERARGTKEVEAVKPPKPTSNAALKPSKMGQESISTPNGKITYTVTSENRVITEESDYDNVYYDYLENYGYGYVFDQFLENPKGKQNWGVLINPNMYAKALREFTQFGKLTMFPTKYIYQWMGIIMKNTAILEANTAIAGHTQYFPTEEFEDFLYSYLGDDREIDVFTTEQEIKVELTYNEVSNFILSGKSPLIKENVTDKYGQMYLPWITQSEADWYASQEDLRRNKRNFEQRFGDMIEYVQEFNRENKNYQKIEYENGKFYWIINLLDFLYAIGMTDGWMVMPDGSDAWSDFALEPLSKIFEEYSEDLEPEKVLVLVNRALDVYHQRGDVASIFIQGGTRSLDALAEGKKIRNKKTIHLSENQIISYGKHFGKHIK